MRAVIVLWCCAVLFLMLAAECEVCESPVEAQGPDAGLLLARLCVNEAGFSSRLDCEAIHQTLRNHGVPLDQAIARHSRRLLDEDGGRWTRRLARDGGPPAGWPPHLAWDRFDPRWRTVLRWADERAEQEEGWPRPCEGNPITWGGRCDDPRGACDEPHPRHREVVCGDGGTRNAFYEMRR